MRTERPILLVEDDQIDIMTVQRALRDLAVLNALVTAENGEDAIRYLQDDNNKPGLILLDLNMPVMNGIEFLKVIKSDARLKCIPAVVLTTSTEQRDKYQSYELGIAGYMTKPVDYRKFVDLMRTIDTYWTLSETI